MVRKLAPKYTRHVSNDAKIRRVILARTHVPRARGLNVYLTGRVRVTKKPARYDRNRVLFVVDMRQAATVHHVDVIRESGIANARHAVADHAYARALWQVKREVD
jgi:hypothetical protein